MCACRGKQAGRERREGRRGRWRREGGEFEGGRRVVDHATRPSIHVLHHLLLPLTAVHACCWLFSQEFAGTESSGDADDEAAAAAIAEDAIYRLVDALAAKTMVPIVQSVVPGWLQQQVRTTHPPTHSLPETPT